MVKQAHMPYTRAWQQLSMLHQLHVQADAATASVGLYACKPAGAGWAFQAGKEAGSCQSSQSFSSPGFSYGCSGT